MRKIKRRVFAVALAAALLFTMPGMASYAEAEDARTEEISESVTVQAEDDAAQETAAETEAVQEPEAEDSGTDQPKTGEDDTKDAETDEKEPAADETVPAQKEDAEECTCGTLCAQDSINGDCPVCGAEDADLSRCKGEKEENIYEEKKEDAGQEDTGAQDDRVNLCSHHKEHTEDCGYSPASEDGEGSPCTYDCRICPIEDLIAALPDEVTEDNAEKVRAQLNKILALYRELTAEEQEQIDLTRCYDLQAALDEANAPMAAVGDVVLSTSNPTVTFTDGECGSDCQGHTITQTGTLQYATIIVESGIHNVTFSGLNITPNAHVGVMPDATMNLTLMDTNTIQGEIGIYVPEDATLVIEGSGSLTVSASNSAAGIGGAYYELNGNLGNCNCGTVTINGGTITATGASLCAGIGGGAYYATPGNGGTVNINGGTVTATGGGDSWEGGAGIGGGTDSGKSGSGGTLTINGGNVTLTAGHSTAHGFGRGSGTNSNAGTLTLADASCLTLTSGTTLDPNGTYSINGDPTPDMIVVPTDLVYTGQTHDLTGKIYIDDSKTGTAEYFGQTFNVTASAEGWDYTISPAEVKEAGDYIVTFTKGGKSISSTFTVAECPHTGLVYTPQENNKHGGTCPVCGEEVSEEHTWVDGTCPVCNLKAVVQVEIGSATTYYGGIGPAWTAARAAESATVTLLDNVTAELPLNVSNGDWITLNGGSNTLSMIGFGVIGGQLDITGGIFEMSNGLVVQGGTVHLSGGTFRFGSGGGIGCSSGVASLLLNYGTQNTPHYAYFDEAGKPIKMTGQTVLEGTVTVTVKECDHPGVTSTPNNDGTHSKTCPYCGYSEGAENCSYNFSGNEGTCTCGDKLTVSVADPGELTYDGTAKTLEVSVMRGGQELTAGTDYTVAYTNNISAGENTASVTVSGTGWNFTQTFSIGKATPDIGAVTAEEMNDTLDVSQVVLSRTNLIPDGTLTLSDSALKYGTNVYTWKFMPDDTMNYEPATGTVSITVNDTIAPAADYQIGTDGWKKFVNTVSFGLFCKDYRTVTIRGTDDTDTAAGSGIELIQYYISDKEITDTGNVAWNTYTEPFSLNAQGTWFVYVKVTDNAGNTAILNSEGIVIYAESTLSPAAFDYTYRQNQDCTVQLTMNGNTFKELTDHEGNAIGTDNYTIGGNGTLILKAAYLDTLDKGGYTYQVSMNPQGVETDQVTLVYTFTVNVKAKELTVTGAEATGRAYNGTNTVEVTAVTVSGVVPGDDVAVNLSGVQGTLSSANAGTYTAVTLPELTLTGADRGNYTLVQPAGAVAASVTITPLDAEITVVTDTYNQAYGDAAFTLDATDNNTEADVQYKVTEGTDVVSVSNGTVTILNAGTAAITVSLPATANYNAAEDKTITITVRQKDGYTVDEQNRSYLYSRENTGSIDLAALLPKDCGAVTYGTPTTSGDVTYGVASAVNDGKLSYTLNSGDIDDEGTITVTVATRNYTDITITVKVKLTDQMPVSLKIGTEVILENNVLTYGEPLSKLVFHEAEFVDDDGKTVLGTLAWKDAAATPNAGTTSAVWVFTPADTAYMSVEGMAAIRVNQATPTVSETPALTGRVYNPSIPLKDDDLSSVTVTGVDGKALEGKWSWESANIVPTVDNSGYNAVFTPKDTTNYETVARTITVNVTKATPYIAGLPAAAAITYGETLKDSLLSGGTAVYGDGAGQAGDKAGSTETVAGAFTWKEPSTKPVVADSNVTEYTILFTPFDTANYSSVEAKVKLTVNKAQNAPNMPGSTMSVPNSIEKVGSVPLPAEWEWQVKDTALEVEVAVSAVAVYTGADKGNYENETVTVVITRSSCDHVAGDVLYTGEGEKEPTCTEDGLGHRECTVCGDVVESGIVVKALGHTGGTATCSRRAVCTRCGEPHGDLDSNVHGGTEVRGFVAAACTAGGYTGDTYCKDCGAKTGAGNATPALGHDYTGRVTKEPTTESEGERTYTCTRCGDSYKESIPRLPDETHEHSYTGRVTKEPTCTDTGVRTYTCACGDSYTETIAALGHYYLSSETKKPTTTEEGVMTYTCDRCGHSYTRPIAKLPGDDTTKPGSSQPGDTEPGIPFIKGEDGKIGWKVIRAEEEQAKEGSAINVDMNGTTVVPGDIFDSIRGRDITITFDMGSGIIWSVNGKSVTRDASRDKAGDIDFDLKTGVNAIPVDIVNSCLINNVTGEGYSIQISLAYEGEFGFTAILSINLGKENAGYTASLYYYNQGTGELEFICADEVAEDGTASLAFTHASDYVIAIGNKSEEEEKTGMDGSDGTGTELSPATGESDGGQLPDTGGSTFPWGIAIIGILLMAAGIAGVIFIGKKKMCK